MADAATLTRPLAHAAADDPVFGVYVHWPFCLSKCPYCDFNSHVRHEKPDETRFARAITTELALHARTHWHAHGQERLFRRRHAVPDEARDRRLDHRHDRADIGRSPSDCEITLEANPTSVEAENFRGYRAAGVNRVSLGVQALDDAQLKALGRLHTVEEALKAVAIAQADVPARFVRSDLCPPRPDARSLARGAEARARPGRRASFALSADHRARDAVRRAASGGKAEGPRR